MFSPYKQTNKRGDCICGQLAYSGYGILFGILAADKDSIGYVVCTYAYSDVLFYKKKMFEKSDLTNDTIFSFSLSDCWFHSNCRKGRMDIKNLKGSVTVELSCMAPVFLMILYLSAIGAFYFYDKNIMTACAYEAVTTALVKEREEEPVETIVEEIFNERIRGKCLLFTHPKVEVSKDEVTACIGVTVKKKKMKLNIKVLGYRIEPEKQIRKFKGYRSIGNEIQDKGKERSE